MGVNSKERIPYYDDLSPSAQQWIRRGFGISIGLYVAHVIVTSAEFKCLLRCFLKWKKIKPEKKIVCVDEHGLESVEEGHPDPEEDGILKLKREVKSPT